MSVITDMITDIQQIGTFVSVSDNSTFTGTNTFTGTTGFSDTITVEEVLESVTITATDSSTYTCDITGGAINYVTATQSQNFTTNFTNVNTSLAVGDALAYTLLITNGATPYYMTAVQVDSISVTPKWLGGAPTEGTASSIEAYFISIVKTADATFTVLASTSAFE